MSTCRGVEPICEGQTRVHAGGSLPVEEEFDPDLENKQNHNHCIHNLPSETPSAQTPVNHTIASKHERHGMHEGFGAELTAIAMFVSLPTALSLVCGQQHVTACRAKEPHEGCSLRAAVGT